MTRRLLLALSLRPCARHHSRSTRKARRYHCRHRQDRVGHVVDDYGLGQEGDELHHGLDHQVQGEGVGHQVAGGQAHSKHRDRRGDRVSVDYKDMSGTLHATQVTVNAKAPTTKQ